MIKASVIIPNYDRADALPQTLLALAGQTVPFDQFEVVVVDDGSTDGSVDLARNLRLPYRLEIMRQSNRGPGAARNLGASYAQSDILIFLDVDMIAASTLLEEHLLAHLARPNSVVVGRILAWPEAYRSLFDEITQSESNRDLGADSIPLVFYHVVSCNFSVQRDHFTALGGFDERLRESEDTEFGYRADKRGMPLIYCPGAAAYHNHPRTFQQRCTQVRSSAFWTAKHMQEHPAIVPLLPIYQDILPITWGKDPPSLIVRKFGRRALALPLSRKAMELLMRVLESRWPSPALLRSLYWKTMSGYRVQGLRDGWRAPVAHAGVRVQHV